MSIPVCDHTLISCFSSVHCPHAGQWTACHACGKTQTGLYAFERSSTTHAPVECMFCHQTLPTWDEWVTHYTLMHSIPGEKIVEERSSRPEERAEFDVTIMQRRDYDRLLWIAGRWICRIGATLSCFLGASIMMSRYDEPILATFLLVVAALLLYNALEPK
jgi:hypothetical protein